MEVSYEWRFAVMKTNCIDCINSVITKVLIIFAIGILIFFLDCGKLTSFTILMNGLQHDSEMHCFMQSALIGLHDLGTNCFVQTSQEQLVFEELLCTLDTFSLKMLRLAGSTAGAVAAILVKEHMDNGDVSGLENPSSTPTPWHCISSLRVSVLSSDKYVSS